MSFETLTVIVIGMIVVTVPFLYYWIKSLKFGPRKGVTDRPHHSSRFRDINIFPSIYQFNFDDLLSSYANVLLRCIQEKVGRHEP